MKILIIKNNVTNEVTLNKGIEIVKSLASTIGLDLQFDLKDSIKKFTTREFSNPTVGLTAEVLPDQILSEVIGKYDIACLIYDWTKVGLPQPKNPSTSIQEINGCRPMQIPIQWYVNFSEVFAEFFLHELCHALFFTNNRLDTTHDQQKFPEWQQKQPKDYYLFLLKSLIKQPMQSIQPTYKYFKPSEVVGLKPELVQMLDKAREIAGLPFKITSGFRTADQNALVGGVQDSAHETGLAVDLLVLDPISGEKINSALHQVGFKRFGYYQDGHIHVDIDLSKPNPCYWIK